MNIFEFIKERVSIFDIVSEYVTLKRAGLYFKGTCPFHYEKTASFTVSPDKGIFYCFGCNVSGDVISFIAKIEACSAKEAVQFLAERYNLSLPEASFDQHAEKKLEEKNHYFFICATVARWCHEQLKKNQQALFYLKNRGFSDTVIDYFSIGYFPGGMAQVNSLLYYTKKESILLQDLTDSHIVMQTKNSIYSPFEERLIFPIYDSMGRCCGFGGRVFKEHDTRSKYYNSRENHYFIKGSLLFHLDKAKKKIQETGNLFLVEGYTDCMAMVQSGYVNTVATLGTACTIDHLKHIARYAHNLFVLYDGDSAGRQAVLRLTSLCWSVNLELKVIMLPAGQDPASFLGQGNDLASLIVQAQDIFFFFIASLEEGFFNQSLHRKLQIVQSIIEVIAQLPDPLKKDILLQQASKAFDIPFDSLKKSLDAKQNSVVENDIKALNDQEGEPFLSGLEKRIFCAIINNTQLLQEENYWQFLDYLPSSLGNIIILLRRAFQHNNKLTFNMFFDMLDEQQKQYVAALLFQADAPVDNNEFKTLILQLQKKQWKLIVHDIKMQLTKAKQNGDMQKVAQILQDFTQLKSMLLVRHDTIVGSGIVKN